MQRSIEPSAPRSYGERDHARLLIANTVGLPDTFQLFEKSSGLLYPASIAWRQANAIGVQFDGPATSIHDPANKRFARLKFARAEPPSGLHQQVLVVGRGAASTAAEPLTTQCIGFCCTWNLTPTRRVSAASSLSSSAPPPVRWMPRRAMSLRMSGGRSSSARCAKSAMASHRLGQRLGDVLGAQHGALGVALAHVAAADVHLGGAAVGRRQRRAGLDLDALGIRLADDQLMLPAHVADDRLVHGVAGARAACAPRR